MFSHIFNITRNAHTIVAMCRGSYHSTWSIVNQHFFYFLSIYQSACVCLCVCVFPNVATCGSLLIISFLCLPFLLHFPLLLFLIKGFTQNIKKIYLPFLPLTFANNFYVPRPCIVFFFKFLHLFNMCTFFFF